MIKKSKIIPIVIFIISTLLASVILNLIQSFYQDLSFSEIIHRSPFEACRILTSHYYEDIYYGGLNNYLALIAMYFFYGLFICGLGGTGVYFCLNKYIFKTDFEPDIWDEIKNRPNWIFLIIIFSMGPTYDFLIFNYFNLTSDNYNCEILIKTIENSWYFE